MDIVRTLFLVLFIGISTCDDELYKILGIRKSASSKEIKQAYKKLAREWHPDKNSDPSATDKFTKINEAYETLSDPEKRSNYDNFGFTSAQDRQQRPHPGGGFHPFDNFFGGGGFGHPFGFGGRDSSNLDKYLVTMRKYESKLSPESHQVPCFLYVYSDFCFSCMRIEPVIHKFLTELDGIGMCVGTIHQRRSQGLAGHLHVSSAPSLIGVVSGRVYYYKSSAISFNLLRDFMRGLFPWYTMTKLNDVNFKDFLEGWKDNRVRAVFFGTKPEPSLRFLAPAFFHKERVAFGYVNTYASDVSKILKQNNVNKYRESLLVWNEDSQSPIASITMQQLTRSTVDEVITSNRFLSLPRLSSQKVFDELCPEQSRNRKQKQLCVALVTRRSSSHDSACATFRALAQTSQFPPEIVRFSYVYEDVQQNFIKALTKGNETRSQVIEVIIFWRADSQRVHYEFLEQGWSLDPETAPQSRKVLEQRLTQILQGDNLLPYRAIIPEFYNEHMLSLFTRILYKLGDWSDRAYYFILSYDGMTIITAVAAILFMGVMAMSMRKLAESEAEQMKREKMAKQAQKRPPSCSQDNQTIHLYEIRSETFANLVSEADTGLTITVLVDETSKEKLLRIFAEIMQPYSRYSGLTFAFLQLEYYLEWYRHLLELSMDFKVSLDSINNRNCVGTVLAINGYRKYYYIYHPKRARRWMKKNHDMFMTRAVGLADSESSDSEKEGSREENVLFLDEVLSRLAIWLDRVFDGSVRKVKLTYWPEMR